MSQTITIQNLNQHMTLDSVIAVLEPGEIVVRPKGIYAPDLHAASDSAGMHLFDTDDDLAEQAASQGWTLETGWTGQHGYTGPCMHESEFVGGPLAEHILETPGYWAAVTVWEDDPDEVSCWAIAYKEIS